MFVFFTFVLGTMAWEWTPALPTAIEIAPTNVYGSMIPTAPPLLKNQVSPGAHGKQGLRRLIRRQAAGEVPVGVHETVCGYVSKNPLLPNTCDADAECLTSASLAGCCPLTASGDCIYISECHDYTSTGTGTTTSSSPYGVTTCDQYYPYCVSYTWSYAEVVTQIFCAQQSTSRSADVFTYHSNVFGEGATGCGYAGGSAAYPYNCVSSATCSQNVDGAGCCPTTGGGVCDYPTTCVDYSLVTSYTQSLFSAGYTLNTASTTLCDPIKQYCYENFIDRGPLGVYTDVGCLTEPIVGATYYPSITFSDSSISTSTFSPPPPSVVATTSSSTLPAPTPTQTQTDSGSSTPVGAIVGGVIGGIAVLAILAGFIAWIVIRHKRRSREDAAMPNRNSTQDPPPTQPMMQQEQPGSWGASPYSPSAAQFDPKTQSYYQQSSVDNRTTISSDNGYGGSAYSPNPNNPYDASPYPASSTSPILGAATVATTTSKESGPAATNGSAPVQGAALELYGSEAPSANPTDTAGKKLNVVHEAPDSRLST